MGSPLARSPGAWAGVSPSPRTRYRWTYSKTLKFRPLDRDPLPHHSTAVIALTLSEPVRECEKSLVCLHTVGAGLSE